MRLSVSPSMGPYPLVRYVHINLIWFISDSTSSETRDALDSMFGTSTPTGSEDSVSENLPADSHVGPPEKPKVHAYVLVIWFSCYVCLMLRIISSNLAKFSLRPPNLMSRMFVLQKTQVILVIVITFGLGCMNSNPSIFSFILNFCRKEKIESIGVTWKGKDILQRNYKETEKFTKESTASTKIFRLWAFKSAMSILLKAIESKNIEGWRFIFYEDRSLYVQGLVLVEVFRCVIFNSESMMYICPFASCKYVCLKFKKKNLDKFHYSILIIPCIPCRGSCSSVHAVLGGCRRSMCWSLAWGKTDFRSISFKQGKSVRSILFCIFGPSVGP